MDSLQLLWPFSRLPQPITQRPLPSAMPPALLLCLLLASLAWAGPPQPCPAPCVCVSKTGRVWCTGGSFQRFPALPRWTRRLTWSGLRLSHFSLSHLPRAAVFLELRGLRFRRLLPANSGIPAKAQELEVEGCCADRFPNLADFQDLAQLRFRVRCPPGSPGLQVVNPALAGLGRNLRPGKRKHFEAAACISVIDVASVRQIFGYREVVLTGNRLRDFSSGSLGSPAVSRLNVSGNARMTQMDIGPGPVALRALDLSGTRLPLQGIAADPRHLLDLRQRASAVPLDLRWLCGRFPKLVHLDVGRRAMVKAEGVGRCAQLEVFRIDGANQLAVPDLRKTKIYHFVAARNRYLQLDLAAFPASREVRKIDVAANAIQKVLVNSSAACAVLQNLEVLDLSDNNLTTLSYDFFKCLPHASLVLRLNVSGNPMRDIFAPFFQAPLPTGRSLARLDISRVPAIRSRGIFPAWLFSNFAEIVDLFASANNLLSLSRFLALLRAADLQKGLQDVRLADNRFSELPDRLFLGFKRLHRLDLARNDLHSLGPDAFAGLTALSLLDLSGNKLAVFGSWALRLPATSRALLAHNPFACSCEALERLANESAFESQHEGPRLQGLRCALPDKAKDLPLQAAVQQRQQLLCPKRQPFLRGLFSNTWVVLALVLGVVVVALVSSLITRCLLKKSDKYWMTTKYTPRPTLPRPVGDEFERMNMMPR